MDAPNKFLIILFLSTLLFSCEKNDFNNNSIPETGETLEKTELPTITERTSMGETDSLGIFYGSVYRDDIKFADIYQYQHLRYFDGKIYNHEIIIEFQVDSIDENTRIYRNSFNLEEYLYVDNIKYVEENNSINLSYYTSINPNDFKNVVIKFTPEAPPIEVNGKGGKIFKAIKEVLEELVEGGDGGSSYASNCAREAARTCGMCNVLWVKYESHWWGGEGSCSFACKTR